MFRDAWVIEHEMNFLCHLISLVVRGSENDQTKCAGFQGFIVNTSTSTILLVPLEDLAGRGPRQCCHSLLRKSF